MVNGKLDEIDFKILNILQLEGRIDTVALSRQVSLSRGPVSLRIVKLQELGYIRKFAAILDREMIGRPVLVVTHIQLEKQTTGLLDEFERLANSLPEVQCCLHVSGPWNFILHITAISPQCYFSFLMEKINSLDNVAHVESCFVMKEIKTLEPFVL